MAALSRLYGTSYDVGPTSMIICKSYLLLPVEIHGADPKQIQKFLHALHNYHAWHARLDTRMARCGENLILCYFYCFSILLLQVDVDAIVFWHLVFFLWISFLVDCTFTYLEKVVARQKLLPTTQLVKFETATKERIDFQRIPVYSLCYFSESRVCLSVDLFQKGCCTTSYFLEHH